MTGWLWVVVSLVILLKAIKVSHRFKRHTYERNLKRQLRSWQKEREGKTWPTD